MKILLKYILHLLLIMHSTILFSQTNSQREQKIQEELSNNVLPGLPKQQEKNESEDVKLSVPEALSIDSQDPVKKEKMIPNDGKIYFTVSAGLAPFQASLGILKYFISELWGQLELDLVFFPSVPVANYYNAFSFYKPYVGFKVIAGYSFFTYKNFEISLFLQFQFAFISTTDIPMMPGVGFRFVIDFFWIDLGASYSITAGGTKSPIFNGFSPVISLGFRF